MSASTMSRSQASSTRSSAAASRSPESRSRVKPTRRSSSRSSRPSSDALREVGQPEVPGVDPLDPLYEQAAALGVQLRQDRCEIRLVLRPRMLRLEEQHDFRALVGNPVGGVLDKLFVGKSN